MAQNSNRMDFNVDDFLFDGEDGGFGFSTSAMTNVNLGVSLSETLMGDVGGTSSSMGVFSGTDVFGFHMNSGGNIMINGSEKEGFCQEKFNSLADGGMLGVVDGGCGEKVGKFSHGLVQNEYGKSVIQCSGGGCAESDKDLVFGLNDSVQIEDVAKVAEVSLDMENLFSRKAFLSDAQVNVIQNYIQHNCCGGLDLVVDLNSYKNVEYSVPRNSVFSDSNYRLYDLVWGKVRGHPWWPGQIYDPSIASEMAKRYWKENCYLVAYFGGQKFAWNEVSMIKPFHKHFSKMARQTDCESFCYAVDCALEEASRRVGLGLSCPCVPEEVSFYPKTEVVANDENGGDRFTGAAAFEPAKLVNFVQSLAQSPLTEFDRLDLASARGQVSAFYRSKGYTQLPEFAVLDRLFARELETLPVREEEKCNDQVLNTDQCFLQNSQYISQNINQTTEKEKLLSEMMSEKNSWTPYGECTLEKKAGDKSTSGCGRKRKASHDTTYDCFQNFQIEDDKSTSRRGRKLNAAYNNSDDCFNNSQTGNSTQFPDALVHDKWFQLSLAAKDPAGESCYTDMIHYFADFRKVTGRNNCAFLEQGFSLERPSFEQECDTTATTYMSTPMDLEVITSVEADATASMSTPEELGVVSSIEGDATASMSTLKDPGIGTFIEAEATALMSTPVEHVSTSEKETLLNEQNTGLMQQNTDGNLASELSNHVIESSPTAFTLKFTNLNSIPSATKLNKIFSSFGPLIESKTELLERSKCARVVFKRRIDAESAFSSAGKYRIFGPSLKSYRLKILPPMPKKVTGKRGRKKEKSFVV